MESNGTSQNSLNSLAERIKAKAEQERQELENLTRQQFNALSANLQQSSKNVLSTTEAAILRQLTNLEQTVTTRSKTLSRAFGRTCLQALLLTLSILTGAAVGGWGLLALLQNKVTGLRTNIVDLTAYHETLSRNTAELEARYKGVRLYRAEGKDYLLLPEGYKGRIAGTVDKQTAIALEK